MEKQLDIRAKVDLKTLTDTQLTVRAIKYHKAQAKAERNGNRRLVIKHFDAFTAVCREKAIREGIQKQ